MSTNRMHRSNRLLRTIMAMLLIVAMTVQQGAYVLADETVPQPVTEASAPQTQAATEKHTEPAAPAPQPETTALETRHRKQQHLKPRRLRRRRLKQRHRKQC